MKNLKMKSPAYLPKQLVQPTTNRYNKTPLKLASLNSANLFRLSLTQLNLVHFSCKIFRDLGLLQMRLAQLRV